MLIIADSIEYSDDTTLHWRTQVNTAVEAWRDVELPPVNLDELRTLTHQVIRYARDRGNESVALELGGLVGRFGLST
jgi:hypothetical protein